MTFEHLAKAAGLTREMIARRDQLLRLYPDTFEQKIKEPKELLKRLSDKSGQSLVKTALHLCQKAAADRQGPAISWIIAALVELTEGGS